jgi:HEAT repeat protein
MPERRAWIYWVLLVAIIGLILLIGFGRGYGRATSGQDAKTQTVQHEEIVDTSGKYADIESSLESRDVEARRGAMYKLAGENPELGTDGMLPVLVKALGDDDPEVRLLAAETVRRVTYPPSVPPTHETTKALREAMRRYKPLEDALSERVRGDRESQVRASAVAALASAYGMTSEVEELLATQYYTESSGDVRAAIVGVLGQFGASSERSLSVIRSAASDSSQAVRHWAELYSTKQPEE